MCHPSRGLHGGPKKSPKKVTKKKATKEKSQRKQAEKPSAAQLFFLMNEDVLY